MNENFDIIIIIVLSLLVAFIIGFNIIKVIDNKLNSVIINVPPQNCSLPQILVNFDKNNNPTKLNQEQINILNNKINNETINHNNQNKNETETETTNKSKEIENENNDLDQTVNTNESQNEYFENYELRENFGDLPDKYEERDDEHINIFAQKIGSTLGNTIIGKNDNINNQNPNYNTIDNYPYLIDPNNPNKGYYNTRVKLITDNSSPLLKLEEKNMNKINNVINSCIKNQPIQKVDATYDGYNKYPNLQTGSYANFTSIGKSLLTPFTSYPVPS
jgi:hypothetical protein